MSHEIDIIYKGVITSNPEYTRKESLGSFTGYAPQLSWVGGSGTASIEVSNDGVVWDELADSSQALSGSGSHTWNVRRGYYLMVRIKFTGSIGTEMKVTFCAKVN